MKKHFLHTLKAGLLAAFALVSASCINAKVNQAVASAQAAMIASSYGEVTDGDSADAAAARLAALEGAFPGDQVVRAKIAFQIAMLRTNTDTRAEANTAWAVIDQPLSRALTRDDRAMYEQRGSLVWYFAKPQAGKKSVLQDLAFDDEDANERQACANAVVGFAKIGDTSGISGDLKLWAAIHRAQIALIHDNSLGKGSNPKVSLPDARAFLDKTRQETGITKRDKLIQRLKATRGYNG